METFIFGITFIFIVFFNYFFIRNVIKTQTENFEAYIMSWAKTTHSSLRECLNLADAEAVEKKITFLENLIEKGFNQSRDRIEKLEEKLK